MADIYNINDAGKNLHVLFPDPGQGSADALRDSLRTHLPHHLITGEYGDVRPIGTILGSHLPTLQAKLWRELPRQHNAGCLSFPIGNALWRPRSSAEEINIAQHVKFIAGELELGRIFILRIGSKHRCRNTFCLRQEEDYTPYTSVVTLEPLIGWATVKAVSGGLVSYGKIMMFTRNGEKMNDLLWTQAVRRFTPKDLEAYCLECLEGFMSVGQEAWSVIDRLEDLSIAQIPTTIVTLDDTPLQFAGALQAEDSLCSDRADDESEHMASADSTSDSEDSASPDEFFDSSDATSFQFDGAGDPKPIRHNSVGLPLKNSGASISDWVWGRKTRRTAMSARHTNEAKYSLEETHRSSLSYGTESSDDVANEWSTDQFTWFTPNDNAIECSADHFTWFTPGFIPSGSQESPSDTHFVQPNPEARRSSPARLTPQKPAYAAILTPPSARKYLAPVPMPPYIHPLFAKRAVLRKPDSVSDEAWDAHIKWTPEHNHRICFCRKPTNFYNTRIAQCARTLCAVAWFHYECLNKSEKLKANHGTMTCEQCRDQHAIDLQNRKMNWVKTSVPDSSRYFPITREDILDMPGTGGSKVTANPYSLGLEYPEYEATVPTSSRPTVLGSLAYIGYEESRPYMVTEAYINPEALAAMEADSDSDTDEQEEDIEEDDQATIGEEIAAANAYPVFYEDDNAQGHYDPVGGYDGPGDELDQDRDLARINHHLGGTDGPIEGEVNIYEGMIDDDEDTEAAAETLNEVDSDTDISELETEDGEAPCDFNKRVCS